MGETQLPLAFDAVPAPSAFDVLYIGAQIEGTKSGWPFSGTLRGWNKSDPVRRWRDCITIRIVLNEPTEIGKEHPVKVMFVDVLEDGSCLYDVCIEAAA